MILDEELERMSCGFIETETAGDAFGEATADFGVITGEGFAGVVEEKREVENEGAFDFLKDIGVVAGGGIFCVGDSVEFFDADEGVFVGGVLVVEFVLDEAGKLSKLGYVFAEESDLVHGPEDGGDVSSLVQDFEERGADMFVANEAFIDEREVGPDEVGEVGVNLQATLLGVEEQAHEAAGLFLKDAA